jgi:hypothetical protein
MSGARTERRKQQKSDAGGKSKSNSTRTTVEDFPQNNANSIPPVIQAAIDLQKVTNGFLDEKSHLADQQLTKINNPAKANGGKRKRTSDGTQLPVDSSTRSKRRKESKLEAEAAKSSTWRVSEAIGGTFVNADPVLVGNEK